VEWISGAPPPLEVAPQIIFTHAGRATRGGVRPWWPGREASSRAITALPSRDPSRTAPRISLTLRRDHQPANSAVVEASLAIARNERIMAFPTKVALQIDKFLQRAIGQQSDTRARQRKDDLTPRLSLPGKFIGFPAHRSYIVSLVLRLGTIIKVGVWRAF
jgi:hypothetical protein